MSKESEVTELWADMVELHRKLKAAKPEERSELSRRYAVTITEYEKAMSYFYMMIFDEFEG